MFRPSRIPRAVVLLSAALVAVSTTSASAGWATRASGTLEPTVAMRVPRMAHTATLLRDGRVLVAGGFTSDEHAVHGAELYDGRSARFVALPRMRALRHSHTATTLADGRVLLVGGFGAGSSVLLAAEIFDPARNTFTSTGSLRAPRAGHIAVALPDGRVLVAGGVGPNWTFLSSAEIYDPATGTFSPTGSMTVARESHVGVALQDGRVLVVGGHRDRRADITLYASAELYDAARGTFTPTGSMHIRRHKHDAVRLPDGTVLVTGGSDERDDRGAYRSTELFDPRTGAFTMGPPMLRARYKHAGSAVALPDGRILLAGGAADAERFDPTSRTFAPVAGDASMAGLFSAVAPLGDGRVLITGGYGNGTGPRASAWIYRP